MDMRLITALALVAVTAGAMEARLASPASAAAPVRRPLPVASLQEIMKGQVAPAADVIWKSTGSVDGKDIKPETDEDWQKVRDAALVLVEAPNLLVAPGRPIVRGGAKLADEGADGNLTRTQMQKAIATNPAAFAAYARALQVTALKLVDAADRKDADAIVEVGGALDEACEACHTKYWYPGAK